MFTRHGSKSATAAACILSLAALAAGCAEPPPPPNKPPNKPPVEPRKTLGKTTQKVLELSQALADGGVLADTAATSGGLAAVTDAVRKTSGTLGTLAVEQKLRLYEAEHGRTPEGYEEFMRLIIAPGTPDGVSLPMLPYYQEWAYDPDAKAVVVVEFPALKEQRRQETTGAAGL
jgi:hypothetical protein